MIDIEIEDDGWPRTLPGVEPLVRTAVEATLASEGADGEGVSLLLTSDLAVQALNARFRGQDKPTNVLSFPAPKNPEFHLGDLALAYGVCVREAAEQGKTLAQHTSHLIVHGMLHLLGYDHEEDGEAEEMENEEREILARLGIADPYTTS